MKRLAGAAAACAALAAVGLAGGAPAAAPGEPQAAQRAAAFPDGARIRSARRHAERREGSVAFAVIDTRRRLSGLHAGRRYKSASTVKTMLAIAYLRKLRREGRALRLADRRLLGPMIRRSDNEAANRVHALVGTAGLADVARAAGMQGFGNPPPGAWGGALVSAADLARLFLRLDSVTPPVHRPYLRGLHAGIVRSQRWGVPRGAPGDWALYFKGGWRKSPAGGRIVHQAARLERGRQVVALAVLTEGGPTYPYSRRTIRGVAERLMRAAAPAAPAAGPLGRAGLVSVRSLARGIRLDLRYASRRNFTGRPLPGYCRPVAVLRRPAARALARVQRGLAREGLGLKVYDAYRPARATRAMVRWAIRTGRRRLVDAGYIARRSNHNRGAAVDLTLVRAGSGRELGMGTAYDSFSSRSHTGNASGRSLRNRLRLKRAMEAAGFRNYHREWWHYDHPSAGPPLDVPLGCRR